VVIEDNHLRIQLDSRVLTVSNIILRSLRARPSPSPHTTLYPVNAALSVLGITLGRPPDPYSSTSLQHLIHLSSVSDTTMASTPIPDSLNAVLARLADRLESLEARLDRIEASTGLTIASASTPKEATTPSPPTKGKGRAAAPAAPSKAKPAKKERPTKKAAIPSSPVPLPLAQTFATEGKTDRHLVTVVIPDASAQHVVGQGGKGLKQIHDISGARVNAYSLATGSRDERHVSIRGTDLQIGDALVVLGKRLARKKIRTPKAKKTGHTTDSLTSALRPPTTPSTLPIYSSTQRSGPPTGPRVVVVPTGESAASSTMPLASTSPTPTPIVPSVPIGTSPSISHLDSPDPALVRSLEPSRGRPPQTARRSRGRW
jgi:hypothetical protein